MKDSVLFGIHLEPTYLCCKNLGKALHVSPGDHFLHSLDGAVSVTFLLP